MVSAQKFKLFEPMDQPFKIFQSPIIKFDSSRNISNQKYFSQNEKQIVTRNNGMPILSYTGYDDRMLIYVPDPNIKQSLIIDTPKGFEVPFKK